MFGGENISGDASGAVFGAAIGFASAMRDQNEMISRRLDGIEAEKDAEIARANEIISDLTRTVRDLALKLNVEQCHSAGLSAYIELIRQTAGGIEALQSSGKTFADGSAKTHATLAYERGYDATALAKKNEALIDYRAK